MNALIIDDNDMTRTLLRAVLEGNGHTVAGEATGGHDGVAQAIKHKPHLVFLDLLMPDIHGAEVLRRIRQHLPATLVLMVTSKHDAETERHCRSIGANGFIAKPFNANSVNQAIAGAKVVDSRSAKHTPATSAAGGVLPRWLSAMSPSNFTIRARLSFGFGAVMSLACIIGIAGMIGLHKARTATESMVDEFAVKERLSMQWYDAVKLNGARTMSVAHNADPAETEWLAPQIAATSEEISSYQKQLGNFQRDGDELALFDDIAHKRDAYRSAREEVIKARKSGNTDDAKSAAQTHLAPALDGYMGAIQRLSEMYARHLDQEKSDVARNFSNAERLLTGLIALAIVLGIACALAIGRSIVEPLRQAIGVAKAVADGDLTKSLSEISGRHEFTELQWALKHMNENLSVLVSRVRMGADAIATASGNVASGSLNLSMRTEQQASSLEETASTMEELTAAVKQNADNARDARQLADSTSAIAHKGGAAVDQVVLTMNAIHDSSKRIADIIGVIDGIAFQTNILALNAAVEAARAGEQGRGFAVVATEVRNLAQRSAAAAKEIKTLIDDSVRKVDDGSVLVRHAGATMQDIVDSIGKLTRIVAEITDAGSEQSSGIEQISVSIVQLDKTTQQNAVMVDKSLSASQGLEQQARKLVDLVRSFKLGGEQANSQAGAAARGTPQEAMQMVKRARSARANYRTKEEFFRALTDPKNNFHDRDMYVFAIDRDGKYLAFGANQGKVGTSILDIPGLDGRAVVKAIVDQCEQGPGWVEYNITNALTKTVQSKISYVEPIEGTYLGCGVYTSIE